MTEGGLTKYASDWFARGDEDLALVGLVLEKRTGSANLVCFHAQQAAEKYLKGFLAQNDLHVRKIHDLEILLGDCKKINSFFAEIENDARFLNKFYVESRYPDDYINLSFEDVETAYAAALRVKEFVMREIKPSERNGGFSSVNIIIVVAFAIAFLAGGGWYYFNRQFTTDNKQQAVANDKSTGGVKQTMQTQVRTATATDNIDTSNWKTYRNEIYGYEISYPKDFSPYKPDEGNQRMIKIIKKENSGAGLTSFRIQTCSFSLRDLFEDAKKERRTEADEIVKREVREILGNGYVGFRTVSEVETSHVRYYPGERRWMLDAVAYLARTYEATDCLVIDVLLGEFSNEEERKKLSPEINLFDKIIATIKFISN